MHRHKQLDLRCSRMYTISSRKHLEATFAHVGFSHRCCSRLYEPLTAAKWRCIQRCIRTNSFAMSSITIEPLAAFMLAGQAALAERMRKVHMEDADDIARIGRAYGATEDQAQAQRTRYLAAPPVSVCN